MDCDYLALLLERTKKYFDDRLAQLEDQLYAKDLLIDELSSQIEALTKRVDKMEQPANLWPQVYQQGSCDHDFPIHHTGTGPRSCTKCNGLEQIPLTWTITYSDES